MISKSHTRGGQLHAQMERVKCADGNGFGYHECGAAVKIPTQVRSSFLPRYARKRYVAQRAGKKEANIRLHRSSLKFLRYGQYDLERI